MMAEPIAAPAPQNPASLKAGGLRERKKQKTREAIQRHAIRLFVERGYQATTVEQIADAAEISPSTFFNYFPTKEDVVIYDPYDPLLFQAMETRPADEPLVQTLRHMLGGALAEVFVRDRDMILARTKLGLQEPQLRSRLWEEVERSQVILAGMVAGRLNRDPRDFEIQVMVASLAAAMFQAVLEWARQDGREDFLELVCRALDIVEAGTRI